MKSVFNIFFLILLGASDAYRYKITAQVFFDLAVDGEELGRIIIGLFGEVVPRTVENFITLSSAGVNGLTYRESRFHRIIRRILIEGGDVVNGNGTGSVSIFGENFSDENFLAKHAGPGFVSMVNSGPNSNGCQFLITTSSTPWLDGSNVVFGKVISGQRYIYQIEEMPTDRYNRPQKQITIANCGVLETPEPFYITSRLYK